MYKARNRKHEAAHGAGDQNQKLSQPPIEILFARQVARAHEISVDLVAVRQTTERAYRSAPINL